MNDALKTFSLQGQPAPPMTIDWEIQPSLQHLVRRGDADHGAPTWVETLPVPFEAMQGDSAFREPLEGLDIRDLDEPEIFHAFFGESIAARARA